MDTRLQVRTLTPEQLNLFYQILIFCESDAINNADLRITNPALKPYWFNSINKNEGKGILLTYKNIDFDAILDTNEIKFTDTKSNVLKSLLYHLRNAFAHNRLFYDDKSKILCMEDTYSGGINMKGKVKMPYFHKFIDAVISAR